MSAVVFFSVKIALSHVFSLDMYLMHDHNETDHFGIHTFIITIFFITLILSSSLLAPALTYLSAQEVPLITDSKRSFHKFKGVSTLCTA